MLNTARTVHIGARTSPMSPARVALVTEGLRDRHPGLYVELVPFTAAGNLEPGRHAELHDKGAFTGEIEDALVAGGRLRRLPAHPGPGGDGHHAHRPPGRGHGPAQRPHGAGRAGGRPGAGERAGGADAGVTDSGTDVPGSASD